MFIYPKLPLLGLGFAHDGSDAKAIQTAEVSYLKRKAHINRRVTKIISI
jgi:hypothetical protein